MALTADALKARQRELQQEQDRLKSQVLILQGAITVLGELIAAEAQAADTTESA